MPWCNNKSLSSTPPPPTTFSMSPFWTSTLLSTSLTDPSHSLILIWSHNHNSLPSSNLSIFHLTTTKTLTSSTTKTTTPPIHTKIPMKLYKFKTNKKNPLPKAPRQKTFVSTSAKKLSKSWKTELTTKNCNKFLLSSDKHLKKWFKRFWK